MQFHVHHYQHADPELMKQLEHLRSLNLMQQLVDINVRLSNLEIYMSDIDDFVNRTLAAVTAQKTKIDSITVLLSSVKNQLADALRGEKLSPEAQAKLAAIFPPLEANTAEIDTAITANTDAAPVVVTPTPAPVAEPAPIPETPPAPTPVDPGIPSV